MESITLNSFVSNTGIGSFSTGSMKLLYRPQRLYWLIIACLLSSVFNVCAQTTAPVIQWQRVIEGSNLTSTATTRVVKASNGGYGILTGKQLVRLSATGTQLWQKDVPGAFADSTNTRTAVQQTLALAPSQDGGFVMMGVDVSNHYYLTKLDSVGVSVWTKTVARTYTGSSVQVTQNGLTATPDGGFLVVGSYTDALSYLTLIKLSAEGVIVSQWRVKFSGPSALTVPLVQQVLPLPGANYLLVGRAASRTGTDSQGLAIKLDKQYSVVWQRVYAQMYALQSAVVNPGSHGVYTAVGMGINKNSQAITVAPNGANDGALLASLPGMATVVSMVSDGTGAITVLDTTNNGDFRLSNGKLPATFRWTKNFGGSGADVPTDFLATDDGGYLAVGTTTSTNGDIVGKTTNTVAAWVLKLGSTAQATTLRLTILSYDCQTGLIRFQANGGNGSPITYTTPGISRANATDTFGTVDLAIRNGAKVVTLQAIQSNQTVSHTFDIGAYCPASSATANADSLRLLIPTYNCQTGALTFNTGGGNGAAIEYAISGILDWTTNPNYVINVSLRTSSTVQPLLLLARQNGRVVSYSLDIKAVCGRARIGDGSGELAVTVLGNPSQETAVVQILGAEGKPVALRLFDAGGRLVEQRTVDYAGETEKQAFDIRQQVISTLLLHVQVNDQTHTVRIIRQ